MGWCSGTEIFDSVVSAVLATSLSDYDKYDIILSLVKSLENHDWDCQPDSGFYHNDPIVDGVFKKLHPDWYENEDVPVYTRISLNDFKQKDGDWYTYNTPTYTLSAVSNVETRLSIIEKQLAKILEKLI